MYTFTDKLFGQPIEAGHINDLQTAVATLGRGVFYPESYGAVGDGVTDDTAAIQAAIEDAGVNGGNVVLSRRYAISTTGYRVGVEIFYPTHYSLLVNDDNVHIWGPGSLVINARPSMPTVGGYSAVMFDGNDGVPLKNAGMHHVVIDASALETADVTAMSQTGGSGAVGFYNCHNFTCDDIYVPKGWGYNGTIQTIGGSEFGTISNCRIVSSHQFGMHLDGMRYSTVFGNRFEALVNGAINLAINGDVQRQGIGNTIYGNIIRCKAGAFWVAGIHDTVIANNTIWTDTGGTAITLAATDGSQLWHCQNNLIANNSIYQAYVGGIDVGTVIKMQGSGNAFVRENSITNNRIYGKWLKVWDLYENVQNNYIINNQIRLTGNGVVANDDGSISITGNVLEPNY